MNGNNGMYVSNPMIGSSQINPASEVQMHEPVEANGTLETREDENAALHRAQVTDYKMAANQESVAGKPLPWLNAEDVNGLQSRWNAIQLEFMNDPRTSVEQAGTLVGDAMKRLEQAFSTDLAAQNKQWNHTDTSTEDLRVALQSYRKLLTRLLAL